MTQGNLFIIAGKIIVLFIYCNVFIVSVIFTLFIEKYKRLDETLSLDILSPKILSPVIESNINFIDDWLIAHNKTVGPILILLSLLDIVILFRIIDLI